MQTTQELKPNGVGAPADPQPAATASATTVNSSASRAQAAVAAATAARTAVAASATAAGTRPSNPTATAAAAPRQTWLSQVRRGRIERPLRALFYGPDGVGKSTLAAGAPNPIFLCSESGTEKLDVARLPEPKSWTDVLGACQELVTAPHDFQTFVVDTLDWLEPLVLAEIVRKDSKATTIDEVAGGFQKGYDRAIGEWRRFLGLVERLWSQRNMNVVLLGHGAVRTFLNPTGEDFERWTLKLWESKNANTPSLFREWVDLVGFCNFEFDTQELGQKRRFKGISVGDARYVHTAWSPAYDAKTRFAIPPVLPLNWDDIVAAIRAESPMDPAEAAAAIEELIPRLPEAQQPNAANALARYEGNARALTELLSRIRSMVGNP